jgi:hypothetical protein
VYVVYMGKGPQGDSDRRHDILRLHHQMLTAVHDGRSITDSFSFLGCPYPSSFQCCYIQYLEWMLPLHSSEKAQASHVYTYSNGFQGFAAKLNKRQAMELAGNFTTHGF